MYNYNTVPVPITWPIWTYERNKGMCQGFIFFGFVLLLFLFPPSSLLTSVAMTHSLLSSAITNTDWYMESLGEHIVDILHSGFSLCTQITHSVFTVIMKEEGGGQILQTILISFTYGGVDRWILDSPVHSTQRYFVF